jgi:Tol biopolymer transport system component
MYGQPPVATPHEQEEKQMNNHRCTMLVAAIAVFLFAGCGPAATVPTAAPTAVPPTALPPPPTAVPSPTPYPPGPVVEAPWSAPPVLDGTIAEDEWASALRVELGDGDEGLFMQDGSYLYLALRTRGMTMGSPCLDRGDEVAILHSSAALGTAEFQRQGESWVQTRDFEWTCRATGNDAAAVTARQEYLEQEGWLASNSYMGTPNEMEYQIAMPEGTLRLALFYRQGPDFDQIFGWPAGLDDGCREFEVAQGNPTAPLSFSPERWMTVQAASPASAGLIAFVSTRDGNGEIYVMNADGSDQRRLTNYRLWDGFPDWSPDGKQIAYYSYLSERNWVIKVMDADGSNPRQLTGGAACDGAPFWSPDGTRIAYTSAADCIPSHRDVYVIDADGGDPLNVTPHPADDSGASWSPDSSQLLFSSDRDGNYELYVMDADGGNVRRLTENDAADRAPAWSPDGTRIAFYSNRDGNDEIYVMDADGGNPRNLTNNPTEDWFPRWSPDGQRITFSSRRGGNLDIYVMNADGSNVRRLTDSPREDFNSVWQPLPTAEPSAAWIRSYEGQSLGTVLDGVATSDGGYLFVGSTHYTHYNQDDEDIYLLKTGAAGEPLWEKTLGGERFDRANRVVPAVSGGFLLFGETRSLGAGDRDLYLLQIDEDGDVLWAQTYGGPAEEMGTDIRLTADGGTILAGQTASFGAGGTDVCLVRTDAQGNALWTQTYGSAMNEEGYAAVELPDGGFLMLGVRLHEGRDFVAMNPDIYLVRTDGLGQPLWSQVWEEAGAQSGFGLLPTSDGHYLIYGLRTDPGGGAGMDPLFLKIDADGNVLWNQDLHEVNVLEYCTSVIETADGGYLLTGMAMSRDSGGIPWVKLDQGGQVLWQETLSGERGNRAGLRILEPPAGGYLIIGTVGGSGRGWYTVLIKTDTEGRIAE